MTNNLMKFVSDCRLPNDVIIIGKHVFRFVDGEFIEVDLDELFERVRSSPPLKPCPFCGGEAKISLQSTAKPDSYIVICDDCCCELGVGSMTKSHAAEMWNRRAGWGAA